MNYCCKLVLKALTENHFLKIYFMLHVAHVSAWVGRYVHASAAILGDQSIGSPGAEVTGVCELPKVGAKNRTQVLWKNSIYFPPLSHLSRPRKETYF